MNTIAGHLAGPLGLTFPVYQVVFSSLNVLVLLPVVWLSGLLTRSRTPVDPRIAAVVLALNPMFFMNTTYAWTKALTAFFLFLGFALYLEGRRLGNERRIVGAFTAMAAAVLTHYSAVPVAVLLALHYLIGTGAWSRPRTWRLVVPGALLLAVWPVYSVSTSGLTLLENASLEGSVERSLEEHVETRLLNLQDTFIPHAYEGYREYPKDATPRRHFADHVFTLYQSNLLISMGSIGGILVVVLAWAAFRRAAPADRTFWTVGIAGLCVTGVLVHGDRVDTGLAMIALQPITYLGLTFLLSRLARLPAWVRTVWFLALIGDGVLGVALPLWFERGEAWARTPNWAWKSAAGVTFLGDLVKNPAIPGIAITIAAVAALLFVYQHVVRPERRIGGGRTGGVPYVTRSSST